MKHKWVIWCWQWKVAQIALVVGCAIASICPFAKSQIVPDRTLPINSTVELQGNANLIQGGTTAGGNLFHSFEQFSLPAGMAAYFNNAQNIQNIIARVTGGSISNIDGLIKANGTANLFLINPNGIIFGANARLNIGGSFIGTTANSIKFADGTEFSAVNPQIAPLLTINVPIGLQMGANPGRILLQGAGHNYTLGNIAQVQRENSPQGLAVQPGRTLAFVGGEIRLEGGTLQDPAGQIELGGYSQTGIITLNSNGSLSFADSAERADVAIANRSRINVRTDGGGSININARNLAITSGSILEAGIAENLGSPGAIAGNIEINATGKVAIAGASLSPQEFFTAIINDVGMQGIGNSGEINITTNFFEVRDGAVLITSTRGVGNPGSININVSDVVDFTGQRPFLNKNTDIYSSGAFSRVESTGTGQGGNININTGSLFVTDGAVLTASTLGKGSAGNININVRDRVLFDGEGANQFSSGAFSRVRQLAVGQGGNINIAARLLEVRNGALVTTSTNGEGNGGNIWINTVDGVTLSGFGVYDGFSSGLFSQTERLASGRGGNIIVNTNVLRLQNGSVINAATIRDTNGGNVTINVNTFEAINGGQVFTTTGSGGKAGDIRINAIARIIISGSDPTFTNRLTQFGAENVAGVDANSGLFANTAIDSKGAGGNLTIETGQLQLQAEAKISVSADGEGAAGDLNITANSIELDNSSLNAETQAGNFGNIQLRSHNLILRDGSAIATDGRTSATGGNIIINTGVLAALENSDITANAERGDGGRVQINSQAIFGTQYRLQATRQSDITASSTFGREGEVNLNTPEVNPSQGLLDLSPQFVDTSRQIVLGCSPDEDNRLSVTGRGVPPQPAEALRSEAVIFNQVEIDPPNPPYQGGQSSISVAEIDPPNPPYQGGQSSISVTPQNSSNQLVEATGWIRNDRGEIVLVASPPTNSLLRISGNCHVR
ncbi:filamentous hemagglutinin N-terminal domain-containing protein [Microseira sp. BLCC-F43]|uniref:two-partner secretion domain-containing protein n=1 Tax=Microseira sp. BLCC-F43 TaxID=3153602 RepID=UPI0035B81972